MNQDFDFFREISADKMLQHWNAYRSSGESGLIGDVSNSNARIRFLENLGFALCSQVDSQELLDLQINLGTALKDAASSLLDERSEVLLEWDVIEEVLCLRYISKDWDPIFAGGPTLSLEVLRTQFAMYADRRVFLLDFLRGLDSVFEEHVDATDLRFEEALWLRDFLQKGYECLVLEVFAPKLIEFEQRLFKKRPRNFSASVLGYRFVRSAMAPTHAVEQRAPWIDRALLSMLSRTLAFTRTIRDEVAAAQELREKSALEVEFRFFSSARSRYSRTNGLILDIDIRYFGKSFERAIDRPLISIIEYLLDSGAMHEDILTRSELFVLYQLLSSYVQSAAVLAPDEANRELYFPPPDLPVKLISFTAPKVSILPEPTMINPARDVCEIVKALEAIE